LKERDIPLMVYYPKPMHMQLAFAGNKNYVKISVTERLCKIVLTFPMHLHVDKPQVEQILFEILR